MHENKWRLHVAVLAALLLILPTLVSAQVPPRFYWKSLSGTNAVPVIYQSLSGNANPLDPAYVVSANANFEADVTVAGYAKLLPLFDRPAMLAVLAPMGRVTATGTVAGNTINQSASGYGDPLVEFNINLIGPKPLMNIPDLLRYEPGFSLDLIVDLAIPIGEYDNDQVVNLGQNRWYGRIGAPIVWQIGAWVPGRRTTLELLPSIWLFGDNDDYLAGQNLETDPIFQLEAHLTRDFTEHFWGSLDTAWLSGGKSTVNGQSGSSLDNIGLGYTLGYQINENMQFTFGYMATINDSDPGDLQMDGFRISLVFGWHPLIEGMGRLNSE
jgi:hypothetical protein